MYSRTASTAAVGPHFLLALHRNTARVTTALSQRLLLGHTEMFSAQEKRGGHALWLLGAACTTGHALANRPPECSSSFPSDQRSATPTTTGDSSSNDRAVCQCASAFPLKQLTLTHRAVSQRMRKKMEEKITEERTNARTYSSVRRQSHPSFRASMRFLQLRVAPAKKTSEGSVQKVAGSAIQG